MNYNYEQGVPSYRLIRQTDPHIAGYINAAIGDYDGILNVGAGLGSYEPLEKNITAVDASAFMCQERLRLGKSEAVLANVENLPFESKSFDVSMAIITVHQWQDLEKAFLELSRVTRYKIIMLTFDPVRMDTFWTMDYFPELIKTEQRRFPSIDTLASYLKWDIHVNYISIPKDCKDGFQEAYFGRPEEFLKEEVRQAQSAWSFLDKNITNAYIERLKNELHSGVWDKYYYVYRKIPFYHGSLCLIEFSI